MQSYSGIDYFIAKIGQHFLSFSKSVSEDSDLLSEGILTIDASLLDRVRGFLLARVGGLLIFL